MAKLPAGVGLVRVEHPGGAVVLVSDGLTKDEEWAARILAVDRCSRGWPVAVVAEATAVKTAGRAT